MGYQWVQGKAVLQLPKEITLSFLPFAPHTQPLYQEALEKGYTLMLHQPMESINHRRLDPGGITIEMSEQQIADTLINNLMQLPDVVGINNHMGSRVTQYVRPMQDFMHAIKMNGNLLFIDSRTTILSIADEIALKNGITSAKRDIFLDNQLNPHKIEAQFDQLISIAKRRGSAIAIGHPHKETIAVLVKRLATLHDVELVNIKTLLSQGVLREESVNTLSAGL